MLYSNLRNSQSPTGIQWRLRRCEAVHWSLGSNRRRNLCIDQSIRWQRWALVRMTRESLSTSVTEMDGYQQMWWIGNSTFISQIDWHWPETGSDGWMNVFEKRLQINEFVHDRLAIGHYDSATANVDEKFMRPKIKGREREKMGKNKLISWTVLIVFVLIVWFFPLFFRSITTRLALQTRFDKINEFNILRESMVCAHRMQATLSCSCYMIRKCSAHSERHKIPQIWSRR